LGVVFGDKDRSLLWLTERAEEKIYRKKGGRSEEWRNREK
jgi:hypothetical protein